MTESLNDQIAEHQADFVYFVDIETKEGHEVALRAKDKADTLIVVRDALTKIAMNQGGIASHTAMEALSKVGLCYHFTQDYCLDTHDDSNTGFTCPECRKFSKDRMRPFE